jgi:hypothetical protein
MIQRVVLFHLSCQVEEPSLVVLLLQGWVIDHLWLGLPTLRLPLRLIWRLLHCPKGIANEIVVSHTTLLKLLDDNSVSLAEIERAVFVTLVGLETLMEPKYKLIILYPTENCY